MRRKRTRFLAVTLALTVTATVAGAQARLKLSLRDAIGMALADGTAARLAKLQEEGALARAEQAHSGLLPRVGVDVGDSYKSTDVAAFGFSFSGVPRKIGPFNFYEGRIQAAVAVVDLAAKRRYAAARAGVTVSEIERRAVASDVARAVSTLYVAVKRAQARVDQLQADVQLFERLRDLAADQQEAGVGTRLDTTRADVQLARRRQDELVAKSGLDRAKLALLYAVGADLGSQLQLTDDGDASPEPPKTLDGALAEAASNRPELAALRERLRALELNVLAIRGERLPRVEAQANAGFSGNQLSDPATTAGIQAGVSIPIFTGHRIEASIAEAEVQRRALQLKIEDMEREIEQQVRQARLELDSARGRVALSERNLALAHEELEQAKDRFSSGVTSSIEVDHAQTSLVDAEQAHIDARADLAQARFDLAYATGDIRRMFAEPDTTDRP